MATGWLATWSGFWMRLQAYNPVIRGKCKDYCFLWLLFNSSSALKLGRRFVVIAPPIGDRDFTP